MRTVITGLPDPALRSPRPLPLLVSMSDIATLARVKRPVVSTWRRRHPDFPAAVSENSGRPLFDGAQVTNWLIATGLGNAAPQELRSELALFGIIALRDRFTPWQLVETLGSLLCLRRLGGRRRRERLPNLPARRRSGRGPLVRAAAPSRTDRRRGRFRTPRASLDRRHGGPARPPRRGPGRVRLRRARRV